MKIVRYKHDLGFSYAFGITLAIELFKTRPETVRRVFIKDNAKDSEFLESIIEMCNKLNKEIVRNDKAFNILSPKENCFVITEFSKFFDNISRRSSNLVLVNPSDAGNIGTIVRTAVGLDFNNIAVIRPAVDVFDPKAVRASMGAIFHANIEYFDDIKEYLEEFPDHNRYAFMLKGRNDFGGLKIEKPFSLIFGNESSGLPDEYLDFCIGTKIEQSGNIDSFSLPMAAGIAMYEAKNKK